MQQKPNRLIMTLLILLGLVFIAYYAGLKNYLSLETLKTYGESLGMFVQAHYSLAVFLYIATYILAMTLSLPVGVWLTLAGGFIFGALPATLYVLISSTIGATLAFFTVRYILRPYLEQKYAAKLKNFNQELERYGAYYLLMAHQLPIIPFFVINILGGLSPISALTFIWTTAVGIIPLTLIYAYAGQKLTRITSVKDILSWPVLLMCGIILAVVILPLIIKKRRERRA